MLSSQHGSFCPDEHLRGYETHRDTCGEHHEDAARRACNGGATGAAHWLLCQWSLFMVWRCELASGPIYGETATRHPVIANEVVDSVCRPKQLIRSLQIESLGGDRGRLEIQSSVASICVNTVRVIVFSDAFRFCRNGSHPMAK